MPNDLLGVPSSCSLGGPNATVSWLNIRYRMISSRFSSAKSSRLGLPICSSGFVSRESGMVGGLE